MQQAAEKFQTPLIYPTPPLGEEEHVNTILSAIEEHIGFVPDGLRLYSLSPPLLEAFVANISYFNSDTTVPASLMTMIRYLVSSAADCQFCIDMNEAFLTGMGYTIDVLRAMRSNPDLAPLDNREMALLKHALNSVDDPASVTAGDIEHLHDLEWSDRAIFDVTVQANNNRAFNHILRTFNIEHQGAYN